ncbi:S1/P1 nuclease [Mucilaginibacter myungsuensis]|uniref:S1/P1 nuclease n=1 Tax=Mucilaginibacter myungsuensis TaxID=649104 RepID=A0A929PYA3_9SPHI|nr:S1/P1 nuclease [Mucilaginibacter myungsuensis]MBE9663127.1 S1/P1 nuclease [Mucilaginibacter myungsuensis]MDN3598762.1 S1/P1 nuclease [Mucilaginibacter myungsuensis]
MKKLSVICLLGLSITLISWGFKGHRAIATIAQKHLSSNTAYVVSAYLKGEGMADVATWADENKNPKTAAWHYVNLPLGLTREAFVKAISESDNNVYTAILKTEAQLKDKNLSSEQKYEALKYLIHLVGDAHQPMHVSRKEDKGGNTIQVRFDNKGTNLHSLWDSKLIDHEGLSESDIAKNYDVATGTEIKQWQSDSPMEWLWESYQISSELYMNTKPGQQIDEAYYQKYITVIRKRVDQAGIRLAGELNKLFNSATPPTATTATAVPQVAATVTNIKLEDVKNAIGKTVTTQGKVFSSKDIGSMVLVNLGAAYPNQMLTVALKGKAKELGAQLENKMITVEGDVIDYKGKPEIIITDPAKIKF